MMYITQSKVPILQLVLIVRVASLSPYSSLRLYIYNFRMLQLKRVCHSMDMEETFSLLSLAVTLTQSVKHELLHEIKAISRF